MVYCKKCEKYGKLGESYCAECGSKLERNYMPMKLSKNTIRILIGALVVILCLLVFYIVGRKMTSYQTVAENYFKAVLKNDTEKIYSYLHLEDDTFVSETLLEEKQDSIKGDSYQLVSAYEKDGEAKVVFKYNDNNQERYAYVLLSKEDSFLFDQWQIDSSKVAQNVTFRVLKDSSIKIDDKEISKYKVKNENTTYDTYQIPYMIAGTYQIKATLPNGIVMDKQVDVSSNSTYTLSYVDLDNTLKKDLEDKAVSALNQLYSSAISRKTYREIESKFKVSLENLYDQLKSSMNQTNLESIHFDDPSIKKAYMNEEGNLEIAITLDSVSKVKEENKVNTKYEDNYFMIEFQYVNSAFEVSDIQNGWRG